MILRSDLQTMKFFEIIKKNGDIDASWIIDDMEPHFKEICDSGLTRNIAQNFTTIWLKLFETVEKFPLQFM